MNRTMRVRAEISMDALLNNFVEMRKKLQDHQQILAVIKADAYGHGAVPIARMLEGEDYIWGFAVAIPEEALELRLSGIRKPILILGLVFEEYYEDMALNDVRITVTSYDEASAYASLAQRAGRPARVHVALDTGMGRIGFLPTSESISEILRISRIPNLIIEGLFTHFARADEKDLSPAIIQYEKYASFSRKLQEAGAEIPIHHCSNSASIMRFPSAHLDLVRAGITIYGIYPSDEVEKEQLSLTPVMSLYSHITYVKEVPAGTPIGYGGTFVTQEKSRIATIPVGYADGYPRMLSNKASVLIQGKRAPVVGRICMDQFMVDVTGFPEINKGTRVTLIGRDGQEQITAEELGSLSGRFSYELVCEISSRVPRVYLTNEGQNDNIQNGSL